MKIVWDEPKRLSNLDKQGFDFADLTLGFVLDATIVSARGGRLKAINRLSDVALTVVFTPLGSEGVSIVSMRPSGANERRGLP
jgi:uncharacterized protein